MRIGWIGLGKLGAPVAECLAGHGHEVRGADIREVPGWPLHPVAELVAWAELIFVAVPTPHEPRFDGTHRFERGRDFSYSAVISVCEAIARAWTREGIAGYPTVAIVSTVLPGTMRREIVPRLQLPAVYHPLFVAMGSVMDDYMNPEFVLIGEDQHDASAPLYRLYESLGLAGKIVTMDTVSAELTKMAYNAFIGLKIAFGNTIMELAQHIGADCDEVLRALSLAADRLISPAYLRGGMGDGGPCHPRDQLALSWLARDRGLSHDLFGDIMEARESQATWIGGFAVGAAKEAGLPLVLLGKAYKADTMLTAGSAALLVSSILRDWGYDFEHVE